MDLDHRDFNHAAVFAFSVAKSAHFLQLLSCAVARSRNGLSAALGLAQDTNARYDAKTRGLRRGDRLAQECKEFG